MTHNNAKLALYTAGVASSAIKIVINVVYKPTLDAKRFTFRNFYNQKHTL